MAFASPQNALRFVLSAGLVLTLLFAFATLFQLDSESEDPDHRIRSLGATNLPKKHHIVVRSDNVRHASSTSDSMQIKEVEQPIQYFVCDGGATVQAVFGDGFCDCQDGTDEVLTSACSFNFPAVRMFQCNDKHNTSIYLSRVNDFICDCPGGLDEYDTLTDCSPKPVPLLGRLRGIKYH